MSAAPTRASACELSSDVPPGLPNPDTRITRVRINQLGYRSRGAKRASIADGSTERLRWVLRDQSGQVAARGETWVLGADEASGDHVHEADFSCVTREGFGYRLQIDGHVSPPFSIRDDVYAELQREVFGFFYRHRSGTALEEAFVGDERFTAPAGHVDDADIGCTPQSPCEYRLNATGGWYGDGAMGKYTVGSALAVWTLQNLVERHQRLDTPGAAMEDNALAIPEAGNGHPDILDTARWHLEWMLAMQLPVEHPQSGMVHHKLHGATVTPPGTWPHTDNVPRAVFPLSTAATLNLAAVAAQAARVWKASDPAFATRCTDAATRAYEAARTHPVQIASASHNEGGHPYTDGDLTDEAFWASVELALTTGDAQYIDFVLASPLLLRPPPDNGGGLPPIIYWDIVQGLALVDLAMVGGAFEESVVTQHRELLRSVADGYLALSGSRAYRTTLRRQTYGDSTTYDLLRNAMVLTLVGDMTGQPRYRSAAQSTLDWVLGRNPLGRSFVTGFGSNPVEHPHHVYWSADPPPGMLVNGPNGAPTDPIGAVQLTDCAQQRCYVDDARAFSTNRVSDHGNAALAWLVAALAE